MSRRRPWYERLILGGLIPAAFVLLTVAISGAAMAGFAWCYITHNLGPMALEAGLYEALWRPEDNGFKTAAQLIPILSQYPWGSSSSASTSSGARPGNRSSHSARVIIR